MSVDTDFYTIGEAYAAFLKAGLAARGINVTACLFEPDAFVLQAGNTPLVTVTLGEGVSQARAGGSYYDTFDLSVECTCIDLSSWATAVKQMVEVFRACRAITRDTPRFAAGVNEAKLGGFEFERAVDVADKDWFAAAGRFQVIIGTYNDA